MSKTTKEKGKTVDVNRAMEAAKKLLTVGMDEMRFQSMLDRYQLANMKADFSVDARVKRANDLKERAAKIDEQFAGVRGEDMKPIERVSNWQPLADYFNQTLAHLKEEHFTFQKDVDAARDIGRAKLVKATKAQEDVIILYHTNRARRSWDQVQQIRAILEHKKLIKKAAPKLPSEQELANVAAGQE